MKTLNYTYNNLLRNEEKFHCNYKNYIKSLTQLNSCNSNPLGVWEFVELDDFSNYRIFGYISEI